MSTPVFRGDYRVHIAVASHIRPYQARLVFCGGDWAHAYQMYAYADTACMTIRSGDRIYKNDPIFDPGYWCAMRSLSGMPASIPSD